jgi:predicted Zn-dependent protease
VTVLPPATLVQGLEDRDRHQLDADACIAYLRKLYVSLSADPSVILIGVTSRDIFIGSNNWRYAENYRREGRFGIVSSARLHPSSFVLQNPEWFNARIQKLISKNIAVLYFDLPLSVDYTSLLSGGVLSARRSTR